MFRHPNCIYLVSYVMLCRIMYWSWFVHLPHKIVFFQAAVTAASLSEFQEKILTSLDKMKEWRDFVMAKIQKKKISMPHFYKLNVMIRNLQHSKAAQARKVTTKCSFNSRDVALCLLWHCECRRNVRDISWMFYVDVHPRLGIGENSVCLALSRLLQSI